MTITLLTIPAAFLVISVFLAIKAVKRGTKTKNAVVMQMLSFVFVCLICFAVPAISSVSAREPAQATTTATTQETSTNNSSAAGWAFLSAALVAGISGIGGGIAVAASAPAAIAATSEDPKTFGKSLIFVALAEGIALYGILVAILILAKV